MVDDDLMKLVFEEKIRKLGPILFNPTTLAIAFLFSFEILQVSCFFN